MFGGTAVNVKLYDDVFIMFWNLLKRKHVNLFSRGGKTKRVNCQYPFLLKIQPVLHETSRAACLGLNLSDVS